MVRKNTDGHYQASSTSELIPSGPLLENIEGMTLWQRKATNTPASDAEDSGPTQASALVWTNRSRRPTPWPITTLLLPP